MAITLNDNLIILAPKPIDERFQVANVTERNALDFRWAGMIVYVEDIGDGTSQWQYLNLKTGDDLTSNDHWVPLGEGNGSSDVIQTITANTANTMIDLAAGNIVYVNVQENTEIDISNIVPGKKYSFIFTMQGPPEKVVTFNTDHFKAAGPFSDVVLSTGVLIDQECVIVDVIGVTIGFTNLRSRSDISINEGEITNVIQNSQYVQQVSYVDSTNGDDLTGLVNDPAMPFETIKAAIDSLTSAICSVRIGTGVYECPVEVLQDIDPRVQSLTMESHATTINATANFIKANQTTLYEFRFFGGNTDIVSGYFGFAIEGSNIYNLELVTKNITGNQSGLVLIHPGFNNVVINGNLTGGTGTGTALTIRGANNSQVYITGDISSSGSSQFSNCIDVRQVKGNLDISWGGTLYTTNLTDWRSNAIRFDSFNSSSNVTFKGNILDDKPSQFLGTILILHNFGKFSHEGNITVTSGNIVRVQQNHTNKCSLSFKGELKALGGSILYSEGTLRDMDVYFDLKDSSFASQGFYLAGAIRLHLNGDITGLEGETSLFAFPAVVPNNIKIFIDDVTFEASEITVPIISPATVTSGTANIKVLGAFRTNSTVEVPAYAGLEWLTDITNPGGAAPDLTPYVKKDGTVDFTAPQVGIDGGNEHLITRGGVMGILEPECPMGDWSYVSVESSSWRSITIIGDRLVAVAYSGTYRVMYSDDFGESWQRLAVEQSDWGSIVTIGTRLVAVAKYGVNKVMYSDDSGETWSYVSVTGTWTALTVIGDRLVAVADGIEQQAMYSDDFGETWSYVSVQEGGWTALTVIGDRLVAAAYYGTQRVMYSDDFGETWSYVSVQNSGWMSLTVIGDRLVAVANLGTNRVMCSDDSGETWSYVYVGANKWGSITLFGNRLVATAVNGTDRIMYSDDSGETWSFVNVEARLWFSAIPIGNRLVAIAQGRVMYLDSLPCVKYVKSNSSIPFTAPQTGVPGVEPNHLATVSQIGIPDAPSDGNAYVRKDGAWVDITTI